ncbi:D-alanyl-D-alanine carboxypeptidase/D-alanyl-D-alanine-endopeptidase [Gillisia sp. Hel_I_29]|uniref:D-alanyl-D-alanine carboxypeptidase/D-alanyl-D-alanine endopeptidase n=1 Tax=Gillisia sp. Hel_I_29 TaxID=1249975 RepID=UPI000552B79A|nr:D-alanyl-D-alanine carboxypeptidase/D-alanyl-D-alanine-endopeptidase [Gillisia sp. Hel_I_29]
MNTFIAYVLKLICIVIFLSLLQSCSIQKQLNRDLKDSKVLQLGFTGFALYDVDSQKMIYTYNADKYFIPASNTKLFTFYTGLKILGDSVPALQYRISGDSLIFRGTGDPSLLYKNLPESKVLNFLKESKQNLYYQPHSITTSGFGPGWAWDDYNDYYSAERSEFPIYGNVVSISESYLENTPRTYPSYFQKILIKSNEDHSSSKVKRVLEKNELVYTDNWKPSKNEQIIPFKTSPQLFAQLLSDTLHKKVEVLNITNSNQKLDRILYSLPSDSIYYKMLQDSDNFIAEQILLMASLKISDTLAPEKAIDFMKRNYLKDLPETKWIDGSGLSRYNLFSPRSIVLLLKKIRKEVPQERLLKMLPAGGKSGTLKDYFVNEPAYIFAKTGTLSNNQALSGYIKAKSGKILIFSFMENNYLRPASEIRKQLEPIFKNIYEKY